MIKNDPNYYTKQYNARAMVPDSSYIFTRWVQDSVNVRRSSAALLNLPYGEHDAERLDFFPTSTRNAPVLVFLHGGWWRSLDKSDFSFIAPAYARAGVNVVIPNYTLAPNATLTEIVCEQLRLLAWLYRRAEQYDMDPNRIVLSGHSAGAHLSAMLMAAQWPTYAKDLPNDLIKGAILLSGVFDLEPVLQVENVQADLKLAAEDVALLSPSRMPQSHPIPFISAVGALESDEFKRQTTIINDHWKSSLHSSMALPDINHLTMCDAFGDPESALYQASMDLIASC